MMIGEAIKKIVASDEEVYSVVGTVKNIDEQAKTCTVTPVSEDADLLQVRLQAAIAGQAGLLVIPKIGSQVVVTFLNQVTGYVALTSEVDRIEYSIADKVLILDQNGFGIESGLTDLTTEVSALFDLLAKLYDALLQLKLITPVGPTVSVDPASATQLVTQKVTLQQIESKINTLLR